MVTYPKLYRIAGIIGIKSLLCTSWSVHAETLSPAAEDVLKQVSSYYQKKEKDIKTPKNEPTISIQRGVQPVYLTVEDNDQQDTTQHSVKQSSRFEVSITDNTESEQRIPELMQEAYRAFLLEQHEVAALLYEKILALDPDYEEAIIGKATAYHKLKQYDQARVLYGKLLAKNPGNLLALNNFLILVGEESPDDAILMLKKFESQHPNLSIIPAQLAMLSLKQERKPEAIRYLQKALALEPGNIDYRYNLAVLFDEAEQYEYAASLYKQLLEAGDHGAELPININQLSERYHYIRKLL